MRSLNWQAWALTKQARRKANHEHSSQKGAILDQFSICKQTVMAVSSRKPEKSDNSVIFYCVLVWLLLRWQSWSSRRWSVDLPCSADLGIKARNEPCHCGGERVRGNGSLMLVDRAAVRRRCFAAGDEDGYSSASSS
jgi:hypothetical protein